MGRQTSGVLASVLAVACLALVGCSGQTGSPSAAPTPPPKAEAAGPAGKTVATPAPITSAPTATKTQTSASPVKGRATAQEAWRLVDPEVQKWQKGAKIA